MESVGNTVITVLTASSELTAADPTANVFEGTPQDTLGYDTVYTLLVATKPGTLSMLFSMDNSVWDICASSVYPGALTAGEGLFTTSLIKARYYKTVFTNTDLSNNNIRLQTTLHHTLGPQAGVG